LELYTKEIQELAELHQQPHEEEMVVAELAELE
jgi:hypothetical protein